MLELHHIREWAVYQTHDLQHMIALCPTCHEQVHRGQLRISDSELYAWKQQLRRSDGHSHTALYVAPSTDRKLYFGFVGVVVTDRKSILQIASGNSVTVEFRDDDLLLVDVTLTSRGGTRLVRLTNGTFSTERVSDVRFLTRTGLVELTAPDTSPIVPRWVLNRLRTVPGHSFGNRVVLFRATVIAPGRVLLEGLWAMHDRAIVATADAIFWVSRTHSEPIMFFSSGHGEVGYRAGPMSVPVFGMNESVEWAMPDLDPSRGSIPIDPKED